MPSLSRLHLVGIGLLTALLLLSLPGIAAAGRIMTGCIQIDRISTFAPRGEVYVQLSTSCDESDFGAEESLVAHIEVHTGKAPPVVEDFRVYAEEPVGRRTIPFENLEIESGDPLLVRLIRFGQILALETVQVP